MAPHNRTYNEIERDGKITELSFLRKESNDRLGNLNIVVFRQTRKESIYWITCLSCTSNSCYTSLWKWREREKRREIISHRCYKHIYDHIWSINILQTMRLFIEMRPGHAGNLQLEQSIFLFLQLPLLFRLCKTSDAY